MKESTISNIVLQFCGAIFIIAVCAIILAICQFAVFDKMDKEDYPAIMFLFAVALFFASYLVNLVVCTWKSGKRFRDYIAGTAIIHFGIMAPALLFFITTVVFGNASLYLVNFVLIAALSGWLGFQLLRSRFFATANGRRSPRWALSTLAMNFLSTWLAGALLLVGIVSVL